MEETAQRAGGRNETAPVEPVAATDRRCFLKMAALAGGSCLVPGECRAGRFDPAAPVSAADAGRWRRTWDAALTTLAGNVRRVSHFERPVLTEGSVYAGVWQECGPHESLVYSTLSDEIAVVDGTPGPVEIARNTHMAFFALQREDGQLPAWIRSSQAGFGQIQMAVPIAATAWELAQKTGDDELLVTAYKACSLWDGWLREFRDTRKTGLVEGFCTWDTGQDHSPRWAGIPDSCPDGDAKRWAPLATLPRLCPDLSATVFGARKALAEMAAALGKPNEADRWHEEAETIRRLIVERLYDHKDAAFYDLDAEGNFVRVRSAVNSRVLGEHVLHPVKDKAIFDALWTRQIHNPKAFWAPYPLTSVAMDDPAFVRPCPPNSWGGASQALTALRSVRWMPFYGKQPEMTHLMQQWCEAILRNGEFRQQLDPVTGEFTLPDPGGYTPAALVFLDFARRLGRVGSALRG